MQIDRFLPVPSFYRWRKPIVARTLNHTDIHLVFKSRRRTIRFANLIPMQLVVDSWHFQLLDSEVVSQVPTIYTQKTGAKRKSTLGGRRVFLQVWTPPNGYWGVSYSIACWQLPLSTTSCLLLKQIQLVPRRLGGRPVLWIDRT